MDAIELRRRLPHDRAAFALLEQIRWPYGVRCIGCGSDRIMCQPLGRYACNACELAFSAATGTGMDGCRLTPRTWITGAVLIVSSGGAISANRLAAAIDTTRPMADDLRDRVMVMLKRRSAWLQGVIRAAAGDPGPVTREVVAAEPEPEPPTDAQTLA